MISSSLKDKKISFISTIPVLSMYIAKGMAIGFLIFMGVFGMIAGLSILNGGTFSSLTPDIYFAFGFVCLIFILTYVVMLIAFPNGFQYRCDIDNSGISQISLSPTKTMNRVAIIGGILRKSPGAVGAGLLAEAGDSRHLSWKEIKVVKINKKNRYCYFSKGRLGLFPIGFFCPEEHFDKLQTVIKEYYPNLT